MVIRNRKLVLRFCGGCGGVLLRAPGSTRVVTVGDKTIYDFIVALQKAGFCFAGRREA